ncbi:MAG: DUF5103 domain-containing protein [Rhodothermia bacterium]|nr:MAG: DUF5103 domain-containing protein [Rhodothermia bacterium]
MSKRVHIIWAIFGLVATVAMSSCASTEEGVTNGEDRRSEEKARVAEGLFLAPTDKDARTIQVYRTGDETSTPLIRLGSGETITVSFDMLTSNSRPLTAYFYHADRDWRRDLTPAEYLTTFQREDLLDYSISRVTNIAYTHYTYRFPTQGIDFRVSGNYILRITEQGMEDEVVFERPFFVSEQAMALNIRLDNVLIAGRGYTSVQPTVQFTPPSTHANAFDYGVCFVRNDRYQKARCSARTALAVLPDIAFYLEPEDSFELTPASYFLDLSEIRVGGRIESTDLSIQPPVVAVAPDYARFPGTGLAPFLNGQTVVDRVVRNVVDPQVSAEYARVFFRFVPLGEVRASGRVVLTGSFNNWTFDEENIMDWKEKEGWYEGSVLLKQGHYEYNYLFDDPRLREAATGAPPQFRNLYTTLVYLADVQLQSDRLLSATGILTQ